jgi:hypothetical protein
MFQFVPLAEDVARAHRARPAPTVIADKEGAYPCRVCLRDARVGERLLLVPYSAFEEDAPYRTAGPVFVHAEPCTRFEPSPRLPDVLRRRLVAVRAYDAAAGEMLSADVVEGASLEAHLTRVLEDPRAEKIHVHFARAGCYACTVERSAR